MISGYQGFASRIAARSLSVTPVLIAEFGFGIALFAQHHPVVENERRGDDERQRPAR
jgi:hypothetical protein